MCMCTFLLDYFIVHHQKHTTITTSNDKTTGILLTFQSFKNNRDLMCGKSSSLWVCYFSPSHALNHIKSPHLYLWQHAHTRANLSALLSLITSQQHYIIYSFDYSSDSNIHMITRCCLLGICNPRSF